MQPSKIPVDAVRAEQEPRRYRFQEALEALPDRPPPWLATIRPQYEGNWQQLLDAIVARVPRRPFSLAHDVLGRPLPDSQQAQARLRVVLAAALLHAGRPEGGPILLEALRGRNAEMRDAALEYLPGLLEALPPRIPLAPGDLVKALEPALLRGERNLASDALEACGRHAGPPARPLLGRLRRSRKAHLCVPALNHFLENDVDDGTLDIVAEHLVEPGIRTSKELAFRGNVAHDMCFQLAGWTAPSKQEAHRQRAAAIVLRVLEESLRAANADERLAAAPRGWLYPDFLLEALANVPSESSAAMLRRVAEAGVLDPRVRADALARFKAMTGQVLPVRDDIVQGMLALELDTDFGDQLGRLAAQDLVAVPELARALARPGWTSPALKALASVRRGAADDAIIVQGMVDALASFVADVDRYRHDIDLVVQRLSKLPRTAPQDAAIRHALHAALATARERAGEPWLAKELMAHLAAFDAGAGLDLDAMPPWDAMREHWRRAGLDWPDAVRMLVQAGAMDPVPPEALHRAAGREPRDSFDTLCGLMADGGRDGVVHLRDIGYEHGHDRLFTRLAQLVRPPLRLDSVVELGKLDFAQVPQSEQPAEARRPGLPVYTTEGSLRKVVFHHQGIGHEFAVAPGGTYADAWAVLQAFDQFMERIGRPERAFWIGSAHDDPERALFACAQRCVFRAACERLRLPVRYPPQRHQ